MVHDPTTKMIQEWGFFLVRFGFDMSVLVRRGDFTVLHSWMHEQYPTPSWCLYIHVPVHTRDEWSRFSVV